MKNVILNMLIASLSFLACDNADDSTDDNDTGNCDLEIVTNAELFDSADDNQLTINEVEINGDCLRVNFSSSGCSGDTWELTLIESEEVLESLPVQRNLKIDFINEELCQAIFTKELTFDLTPIKLDGGQVYLNLSNYDAQIFYEY